MFVCVLLSLTVISDLSSGVLAGVSVSSPCGGGGIAAVERGVQSSLPSLTYEALRALGEDIEAFRQMHQLTGKDGIPGRC